MNTLRRGIRLRVLLLRILVGRAPAMQDILDTMKH